MDGPQEAALIQPGPEQSKKRALSRSPSNSPSPSQAPPQKKTSYEQEKQTPVDHVGDFFCSYHSGIYAPTCFLAS